MDRGGRKKTFSNVLIKLCTFEKSSFPLDRKIEKNGKRMEEKERKGEVHSVCSPFTRTQQNVNDK